MSTIAHPAVARPIRVRPRPRSLSPLARYWLAAAIAFLGVAAGLTVGVDGYRDAQRHVDGFDRVSVPGTMTVTMEEPGGRVAYYEGDDTVRYGELSITVTDPDGAAVDVRRYDGEMVYETPDGVRGRAVATFHADAVGAYEVAVRGVDTGQLSVGDSFARRALPAVLGGLAIVLVGMVAGFVLWLVTFVKRTPGSPPTL